MTTTMKQRFKFSSIIVILSAFIVFLIGITYETYYVLDEQKNMAHAHVDMAYNVLTHFNNLILNGIMTKEQAQREAKEIIRVMTYTKPNTKNQGYFWIGKTNCMIVMHKAMPELENRLVCDLVDATGNAFYNDFITKAQTPARSGFVEHDVSFIKGYNGINGSKITYVRYFDAWEWIVGNGFYKEDVYSIIHEKSLFYGILYGTFIALCVILILFNIGPMLRNIPDLMDAINKLCNGEYDFQINHKENDDCIGVISRDLDKLRLTLKERYPTKFNTRDHGYFTNF